MSKTKILITLLIVGICIICMPKFSYGANEELVVLKKTENEYIVYLKQYLNQEFEFAFSNDADEKIEALNFISSALDNPEENSNNIAYVDSNNIGLFNDKVYMWVKVDGELKISAREIKLDDNITEEELVAVGKTSKVISIKLEREQITNEVDEDGVKITETVGVAKLLENSTNIKYQLIKREESEETNNLFALAELIEKNEFTDVYTKIKACKDFINCYNMQYNALDIEKWEVVENAKVQQPIDAQNGEQYILWLKNDDVYDVHFLTSYREYDEEIIKEEIRTKLPHTYDNNVILIVLGIVIIAIVIDLTVIAFLKKKEMNK